MTMKRCGALLVFLMLGLLEGTAFATPEFPQTIQDHLGGLDCRPDCILCHRTNMGGGGAELDKAFAQALKDQPPVDERLYAYDNFSVGTALDWAESTQLDTNDNGIPDVDELVSGIYPSTGQRFCGEGALEGPAYGCGARVAPAGPIDGTAAVFAALAALVLARSRRRGADRG